MIRLFVRPSGTIGPYFQRAVFGPRAPRVLYDFNRGFALQKADDDSENELDSWVNDEPDMSQLGYKHLPMALPQQPEMPDKFWDGQIESDDLYRNMDGYLHDAYDEDELSQEAMFRSQMRENDDDNTDHEEMMRELAEIKTNMKPEDFVMGEDWIKNPDNETYFNPSTGETKVPFEKSWKEYARRRATRMRNEVVKQRNEVPADYISPIPIHNASQFYPPEQMKFIREKYNYLNFENLKQELEKADRDFFQFPPQRQPLDFKAEEEPVRESQTERDHEAETMKFLGQLKHKFHVGTFRCTKMTKVGKKHSYAALVVGGNGKGWAGFGYGKGLSPDKATRRAANELRKNLTDVPLHEGRTISQSIVGKHCKTKVIMRRCKRGHGMIGSKIIQAIMQSIGVVDISTKITGAAGKNPLHVVYATFKGLARLQSAREKAEARGVNYYEIYEPTIRERPPTREELRHKAVDIHKYMEQASKLWRTRTDLHTKAPWDIETEGPYDSEFEDDDDAFDMDHQSAKSSQRGSVYN